MRALPVMVALVVLCGCGGEEGASTQTPSEDPFGGGAPAPVIPADDMVQQMQAQLVLDHPQVRPYLHSEVPDNLPLTVHAVPELAEGAPELTAGGQSVRVVDAPGDARFRFTELSDLDGPRVRVRFEIPAEGVAGHVDLELRDYVWSAIDADVAER